MLKKIEVECCDVCEIPFEKYKITYGKNNKKLISNEFSRCDDCNNIVHFGRGKTYKYYNIDFSGFYCNKCSKNTLIQKLEIINEEYEEMDKKLQEERKEIDNKHREIRKEMNEKHKNYLNVNYEG